MRVAEGRGRMAELERLADGLQRVGAQAALLSSFEDVCYATGFEVPPPIDAAAAFAYGPALALVSVEGRTTLLVPNAYAARVEEMSRADENVLVPTFDHFVAVDHEREFLDAVRRAVATVNGGVLAVDRRTLPASAADVLDGRTLADARPILREARW